MTVVIDCLVAHSSHAQRLVYISLKVFMHDLLSILNNSMMHSVTQYNIIIYNDNNHFLTVSSHDPGCHKIKFLLWSVILVL